MLSKVVWMHFRKIVYHINDILSTISHVNIEHKITNPKSLHLVTHHLQFILLLKKCNGYFWPSIQEKRAKRSTGSTATDFVCLAVGSVHFTFVPWSVANSTFQESWIKPSQHAPSKFPNHSEPWRAWRRSMTITELIHTPPPAHSHDHNRNEEEREKGKESVWKSTVAEPTRLECVLALLAMRLRHLWGGAVIADWGVPEGSEQWSYRHGGPASPGPPALTSQSPNFALLRKQTEREEHTELTQGSNTCYGATFGWGRTD